MCGIAGYSLNPESSVKRTLAAQALLAGIAERGADAVGYAHRGSSSAVTVHKRRSGASALLDEVHVPAAATQVLVHVRDYTKGHPTVEANNHPIRHGSVVGIHNGIIVNDEEILTRYGFATVGLSPLSTPDSILMCYQILGTCLARASRAETPLDRWGLPCLSCGLSTIAL